MDSNNLKARKSGVGGGVTPVPWRNEKSFPVEEVEGAEELVKHMSNVPSYLQGVERVDCVQPKAISFGVIDRERLEKWAYDQKPSVDLRGGDSTKHTHNSSSESCISKSMVEEDHTKHVNESFDSRTSRILHASLKFHQFSGTGQSDHEDASDRRTVSSSSSQCGDISISTPTSEDYEAAAFKYSKFKFQNNRFKEAEKIHSYSPVNSCSSLSSIRASPQEQYLSEFELPTSKSKGGQERYVQYTDKPADVANKSGQDAVHTTAEADRRLSSSHLLGASLNWTRRSSSVRNGSSVEQIRCTRSSVDSYGEKQDENNKGRASPFRRMLDPLLKSKNRIHSPGSVASSSLKDSSRSSFTERPHTKEESTPRRRSFHTTKNFLSLQGKDNSNSSSQLSTSSLFHTEKHATGASQALLQLTWKDGLPMFTLSSNDSNILAATLGKKSIRDKGNLECIYTILSVHEVKKKTGIWMNHGNKDKMHGFFSNVIGRLNVSCSELDSFGSEGDYAVNKFVLFGAELLQDSHEPVSSISNNELAAIVIKTPKERADGSLHDLLKNGYCKDPSKINFAGDECWKLHLQSVKTQQNPEYMRLSTIAVILPSGVHGFSTASEPSSLIKRWKSGGQCDCGGWDEGCKLTILTDDVHDNKGFSSNIACDRTNHTGAVKLVAQGGSQDNRHSFSMFSLKEGVHIVDFGASISLLQAFAICLATLHSRKHENNFPMQGLLVATNFEDDGSSDYPLRTSSGTKGEAPMGYIPQHPPLSPVGRA